MTQRLDVPTALTIAGSDPGGGAGIQADLKTFASYGVFGTAAITALTAQNTLGVHGACDVPAAFVRAQIDAVLSDVGAAACKTGMLAGAEIVEAVADALSAREVANLVCDPVMVAKGGARLLAPAAEDVFRRRVLPLARLVTPNADEVAVLTGIRVDSRGSMEDAARAVYDLGPDAVLIKGGHVEVEPGVAMDLFYDGDRFMELRATRLREAPTHGAGCTLSAAITAGLALGLTLEDAVRTAKRFLHEALRRGGVPGEGKGHGCPNHAVRPPLPA